MQPTALPWLDSMIAATAGAAVALRFAVNRAFAVGVVMLRDHRFVNRWTKPLLVADAALLITAVGAPMLGVAMRLGLHAFGLIASVPTHFLPGK